MATSKDTMDQLLGYFTPLIPLTAKKMFGEYGLYLDGKMVAMVCDDLFYIKSSQATEHLAGLQNAQPPYHGAKPAWVYTEEEVRAQVGVIAKYLHATALALPAPKPRKTTKPSQ